MSQNSTFNVERLVWWPEDVTAERYEKVVQEIKRLHQENPQEPVNLAITSWGGNIDHGFAFYDSVRYGVLPVTLNTFAVGAVDSMAVTVFLAGEKRFIGRNATIFLHLFGRQFKRDTWYFSSEIGRIYERLTKAQDRYAAVIAERTNGGISQEQTLQMMRNETLLSAKEVVELGLAHEILGARAERSEAERGQMGSWD